MAADLLIGSTAGLFRQELGQRYLDVYEARKDAFSLPDNDTSSSEPSDIRFTGNRLIDKAAQLVLDLEAIDAQEGLVFEQNADITSIIEKYDAAVEAFGQIKPDEDFREQFAEILNDLEAPAETLAVDEKA